MAYQFASLRRTTPIEEVGVQATDPFLTRVLSISALTREQVRILTLIQGPPRHLRPHTPLGRTGDPDASAYVIREGWAFAYTLLANGERQVVGFLLPGDLVRVGCTLRGSTELCVETITDTLVTEMSMASVRSAARQWPEIFELFLRLQSQMLGALVDQLVDLGRRDSRARVAQFVLKLERRLMSIGHAEPDGYAFPISQYLIADAVGLTAIHVNRVLRGLREEEIVTVRRDRVTIQDRARLLEIAGDDDSDGGGLSSNRDRDAGFAADRSRQRLAC
jgi:CRP-like cAMP-binding protein